MVAMGRGSGQTPSRVVDLIKEAVAANGQNATARALKIPLRSVQKYLEGSSEPTQATLEKLAKYFQVSVEWLRGSGNWELEEEQRVNEAISWQENLQYNPFGDTLLIRLLKLAIAKMGVTTLAERCGLRRIDLERYLRGKVPSEDEYNKLSECLKYSVGYLKGEIHPKEEETRRMSQLYVFLLDDLMKMLEIVPKSRHMTLAYLSVLLRDDIFSFLKKNTLDKETESELNSLIHKMNRTIVVPTHPFDW